MVLVCKVLILVVMFSLSVPVFSLPVLNPQVFIRIFQENRPSQINYFELIWGK